MYYEELLVIYFHIELLCVEIFSGLYVLYILATICFTIIFTNFFYAKDHLASG